MASAHYNSVRGMSGMRMLGASQRSYKGDLTVEEPKHEMAARDDSQSTR